jgi:diguanylate cyclase (GGDEF)-like protein
LFTFQQRDSDNGLEMNVHVPTLFLLLTAISATLTVSISLVARAQTRDGMVYWAWAFAFHTAGYFLYILRGQVSDVLSIVLANMAFACHLALIAEGVLQFQHRKPPRALIWSPVLIVAVVYSWLLPWQTARFIAGSVIFSAQSAGIVAILLQRRKDTVGVGQHFMLTGYFILIAALAAQAVGTLLQTEVAASLLLSSPVTTLTFMAATISTLLVCLGLIVMTKERADERNRTLAMRDEVTGLINRRMLLESLTQHLSAAKRHGQPLSVLLLDIDFFKRVNDTYGHLSGDKVLKSIACVLEQRCRKQDYFGRFGGEEFLMILPNTDAEGAMTMAEALRSAVEAHSFEAVSGESVAITVSIGLCALSQLPDPRCDDLIGAADKALYRAKASGRNRVEA